MNAGRIAVNIAEVRKHRVAHLRIERRGGVVVKIDAPHCVQSRTDSRRDNANVNSAFRARGQLAARRKAAEGCRSPKAPPIRSPSIRAPAFWSTAVFGHFRPG